MRANRSLFLRWAAFLGVLLGTWNLASYGLGWVATQPPPRKEEEEETPKPPKPEQGSRGEEELADPKLKHKVIRVDEPNTPTRPAPASAVDIDLKDALKTVKHPGIKRLFSDLAIPHDVLTIKNEISGDRPITIRPLADYVGKDPASQLKRAVTVRSLDNNWKEGRNYTLEPSQIRRVTSYEELAPEVVNRFLTNGREQNWDKLENQLRLSLVDQLLAAEQALSYVLRFHESARASDDRRGDGWEAVQEGLRGKQLDVILQRLQISVDSGDWEQGMALARQTAGRFPLQAEQDRIAKALTELIKKAVGIGATEESLKQVQQRMRELEEQFPLSKATEPIRQKLIDFANPLLERAKVLKEANQMGDARKLVEQAKEIYPGLPGLRELGLSLEEENPVLRVGVRQMPQFLSPGLAHSDPEKQALELLFESLMKGSPYLEGGRHRPGLAAGQPRLVPLGRQFTLPREAAWSNGRPITSGDVRETVRLLQDRDWDGRTPAWADELFDGAETTDSYRVRLTLKQGFLDPLSAMSFKIVPEQSLRRADDEVFGRAPIGSGPYALVPGSHSDRGRFYLLFRINPYYAARPGLQGLPRIHEIHFFETQDPVKDLADNRIDLVLDLPGKQVEAARKLPNVVVPPSLRSRRIYFLAINHRHPQLSNLSLRRAINRAIPREEMLNRFFREGLSKDVHQPLNGPYPPGSWACDPKMPADLLDVSLAKAQLEESKKSGVRLTLKYPNDDPALVSAMEFLVTHFQETLGITLELQALPSRRLREEVELGHEFDLAYCSYEYADSTFFLWPLLDSRSTQPRGRNYMGYSGGTRLEQLFRNALSHRDFDQVRKITHTIHRRFSLEEVPFVPLWQLDRHLAFSSEVKLNDGAQDLTVAANAPLPLDPNRLFSTVEFWRLRRK